MNKKTASKQYAANQMGMSGPKRPKKNGGSKSGDNVEVCTAKTAKEGKCGAYAGGGPSRGSGKYTMKTSSSAGGEKNKVLTKKQAEKRAVKFAENRAKAAQPKKLKSKF